MVKDGDKRRAALAALVALEGGSCYGEVADDLFAAGILREDHHRWVKDHYADCGVEQDISEMVVRQAIQRHYR